MSYEFLFNNRYEKSLVRILEIIWQDLNLESVQTPSKTKTEIFNKIVSDLKEKRSFTLHKSDVVFYITPDSPWVARLHLFTVNESVFLRERFKAGNELTQYIFRNTPIEKLYGITPNKKFLSLAKYAKWKPGQEGILTKSYRTNDGKLIDQIIISVNKSESMRA